MACDPIALFETWYKEACASEPGLAEAVALATANRAAAPSVRMVLLKGYDQRGFVFYTNSFSRKGRELEENPQAALLFHWKSLDRQVRIEGEVVPVSAAEADLYFATRARQSQLGAWASQQSRPLENQARLEEDYRKLEAEHEGASVPRPPHWLGYRVVPARIEYWSDRAHRLHERRLFTRSDGEWIESRLYP